MRGLVDAVLEAEVPDVRADGDAGTCTCTPAPYVSTFAFTLDEGSGPQVPEEEYSSSGLFFRPIKFSTSETGYTASGNVTAFAGSSPVYVSIQLDLNADRTLRRLTSATVQTDTCTPDYSVMPVATVGTVAVTTLTEETAELRVSRLTVHCRPDTTRDAGPHDIVLTNIVFRAASPGSKFVTPPRAYEP